jgi:hypothetical protein
MHRRREAAKREELASDFGDRSVVPRFRKSSRYAPCVDPWIVCGGATSTRGDDRGRSSVDVPRTG